ncbi:MAG: SulP family inorganic anion transporter [Chlamydiales bacterium]
MAFTQEYEDLSFQSLIQDIKGYSLSKLRSDLLSGISVTLVSLPQAMAFSLVAGLPLSCGILSAIFGTIVAALFSASRHLVVGPNNATAIMVQFATSEILYTFYRDAVGYEREAIALQILTQLVFLVSLFQIIAATCKLGRLVQFVSHSVVVGYLVGTALAVVITQLYTFLGMPSPVGVYSLFEKGYYIFTHLKFIHLPTAFIGLGSLIMILALNRINSKIPAAVIAIIFSSLAVHYLGLTSVSESSMFGWDKELVGRIALVGDAGELNDVVPHLSMPILEAKYVSYLFSLAFAIALLGMLETSLVAKALATSSGQRLAVNQEILALGVANLVSSCVGALPSSGSPTRSMLLFRNGGQTRFAAVFNGIGVGLIVMIFGYFVSRTPLTTLSAILLISASRIVNSSQLLLCVKATYADAFVLIATLLSCLFFTLDVAFYVGVSLSIIFYLKKAAEPNFYECTYDDTGRIGSLNAAWNRERKQIRVINVQGELFFGAADLFQMTLKSVAEDDTSTHVIILRLKNARDMDATTCLALQQLYEYLQGQGRHLLACGLTHQSWEVLCDSGVVEKIGKDNLFILDEQNPRLTLQRALARAKELVNEHERRNALENLEEIPPVSEEDISPIISSQT